MANCGYQIIIFNFHIVLLILLGVSKCNSSDKSELSSDLLKLNDNMNVANNQESVLEPGKSLQNISSDENDLKNNIVPVLSSKMNSTAVMEGFTIFFGLSLAIVLYFTIKAVRLRRRRYRVRKYGLLTSREDVEMTPLGEEEDDEDSTVFDISDHPRSSRP